MGLRNDWTPKSVDGAKNSKESYGRITQLWDARWEKLYFLSFTEVNVWSQKSNFPEYAEDYSQNEKFRTI